MNKKLITGSLIAALVFSFTLTTSVSAFWPFDSLFKKSGDVKAETTEKKMVVGDVGPGGSKAFMTYQTLATMNDACRRMLSLSYPTPTKVRITPSAREGYTANGRDVANEKKMVAESTESINRMYELEFGIDPKSEKELAAIYTNLKARCENIASLTNRMQRIYKGNIKPVVTPTSVVSVTSSPKMKCDLNSRVKNYGCPMDMTCNSGYCQPVKEIPTTEPTLSIDLPCGGTEGVTCPSGYVCQSTREKYAVGKCVKSEIKNFNIR